MTRVEALAMQGPLPPPDILSGYDAIVPGAAERILAMAEKQNDHRIEMEQGLLSHQTRNERAGLRYAFLLALAGLVLVGILAWRGAIGPAVGIAIAQIAALVGVFVYGRRQQSEDQKRQRNA